MSLVCLTFHSPACHSSTPCFGSNFHPAWIRIVPCNKAGGSPYLRRKTAAGEARQWQSPAVQTGESPIWVKDCTCCQSGDLCLGWAGYKEIGSWGIFIHGCFEKHSVLWCFQLYKRRNVCQCWESGSGALLN